MSAGSVPSGEKAGATAEAEEGGPGGEARRKRIVGSAAAEFQRAATGVDGQRERSMSLNSEGLEEDRPKTRTSAPMSSWNMTTLGTPPPPTWLPTRNTNTQERPTSRLPRSIIVITPSRASDFDFASNFQDRTSQTASDTMLAYAIDWPHTLRRDSSNSDDELHKGIMLILRRPSTCRDHRRPVIVTAWTRSTADLTPQQHIEAGEPIGHAGKTDYRRSAATRPPLEASSLPNFTLGPSKASRQHTSFTKPLVVGNSETMPPRR